MSAGVCMECGSPLDDRDRCHVCLQDSDRFIGPGWADIEEKLAHFPEDEREVLMLRFRNDDDGKSIPLNVRDIASRLGKSPEEVIALERSAVNRLKRRPGTT